MTTRSDEPLSRSATSSSSLFGGAGAIAALCTAYQWEGTSIGCPEDWPAGLRTTASLVLGAPTPMILLWGADATQIYNDAYCALLGAKHPGVFAAPVSASWPEGWHLDDELYRRALNGEAIVVDNATLSEGRAGETDDASFSLSYSPARDEAGVIQGVLVIAFETSSLAAAQQQARAAVRAKADFLAVMSHELRTPLNAIGGYAELLELGVRGPITSEQRGDLERIRAGQQHLVGVIDDVLAYTKLEAGILHFTVEDVPMEELLTSCCALIGPMARQKMLDVRRSGSVEGLAVRADAEKAQQVIMSLLNNAVKFTDPGGVITVSCHEERGERIDIAVSDTGRGIASTDLESVFQPFVQVDAKLTRTVEGAGLGLAIARQMAQRMGGDLSVASELGVGSRFTLTLACGRRMHRGLE